nr:hypothetical protein [Tanacetum cinerariifolium]
MSIQMRYIVVDDETMEWLKDTIEKRVSKELGKLRNEIVNMGMTDNNGVMVQRECKTYPNLELPILNLGGVKVNVGFFDMRMPNVAWYLKVRLASFRDNKEGIGPLIRSIIISMNITSPPSSLEQSNFELGDWGTNPSDTSIEFSFRSYYVAMEANGSGCGCRLLGVDCDGDDRAMDVG